MHFLSVPKGPSPSGHLFGGVVKEKTSHQNVTQIT